MTTTLPVNPHIYKKGKILNLKRLSEEVEQDLKNYTFSSHPGSARITTIIASTNNLNQITGRILLGVYKMLSYFGLSKDPSEKFSKAPSYFGKYCTTYFQRGGSSGSSSSNRLEEIKNLINEINNKAMNLLVKNNEEIKKLTEQIDKLSKNKHEIPISRKEVVDFTSKLIEIEDYLRKILG